MVDISSGVMLINAKVKPGWELEIDTNDFRMSSPNHCVIGLLNQNGLLGVPATGGWSAYENGMLALGVPPLSHEAVLLGFERSCLSFPNNYINLTIAWRSYLRQRQTELKGEVVV